jgi:putative DNA primase/helicase
MTLESHALAQLSSEGQIFIRKLGRHEEGTCDCRATTTFMNGNNILVAADLVERTVFCRLNARTEEPGARQFSFDPVARVREDRGAYLADCFIIARGFLAAGAPRPQLMRRVAGFDEWSRFVQQPLIWLGCKDSLANQETARTLDPSREQLRQLLAALRKGFDEKPTTFTVADCAQRAKTMISPDVYAYPELREQMSFHGDVNARSFGRLLMRHLDRIDDGWGIKLGAGGARVQTYELFTSVATRVAPATKTINSVAALSGPEQVLAYILAR